MSRQNDDWVGEEPVIKDDEGKIEDRNKAQLHRVYFKDYQVEYLENIQDVEKITFGEAVRVLIDNEIGQFNIFAKLTSEQAIVITADGKLTVVDSVEFTDNIDVPMTSHKAHQDGGMFYG